MGSAAGLPQMPDPAPPVGRSDHSFREICAGPRSRRNWPRLSPRPGV